VSVVEMGVHPVAQHASDRGGFVVVEVVPRVSVQAGFELATGILVNTVPPEQAAEMLRGARVP
jgi:UDPglucose--hexose-1-phosphate uridylyltransferase